MSEYTMSKIPATPMDAVKQIYELFQDPTRFIRRDWAQNREHYFVAVNDKAAYCWCLSGAVFRVYNVDIVDKPLESLPINLNDTFKLLWEKLPIKFREKFPAGSKFHRLNTSTWGYINGITEFNDKFGYKEVIPLLKAVIDDTEYTWEA